MDLIGGPPPARYDHPPIPPLQVIERVMTREEMEAKCAKVMNRASTTHYEGCEFKSGSVCWIYLPQGSPDMDAIRRHETAHCNGWGPDHEQ